MKYLIEEKIINKIKEEVSNLEENSDAKNSVFDEKFYENARKYLAMIDNSHSYELNGCRVNRVEVKYSEAKVIAMISIGTEIGTNLELTNDGLFAICYCYDGYRGVPTSMYKISENEIKMAFVYKKSLICLDKTYKRNENKHNLIIDAYVNPGCFANEKTFKPNDENLYREYEYTSSGFKQFFSYSHGIDCDSTSLDEWRLFAIKFFNDNYNREEELFKNPLGR